MYLSINQVAARYGVATITIRRWWQAGYLPAPVKIGGSHRWSIAELEAFEASLQPAGAGVNASTEPNDLTAQTGRE